MGNERSEKRKSEKVSEEAEGKIEANGTAIL
jgi:hypothetical protein